MKALPPLSSIVQGQDKYADHMSCKHVVHEMQQTMHCLSMSEGVRGSILMPCISGTMSSHLEGHPADRDCVCRLVGCRDAGSQAAVPSVLPAVAGNETSAGNLKEVNTQQNQFCSIKQGCFVCAIRGRGCCIQEHKFRAWW